MRMPNWCYSTISLNGEGTKEQKEFLNELKKRIDDENENRPLCNYFIPMPKEIEKSTSSHPKIEMEVDAKTTSLILSLGDAPDHYGEFNHEGNTYKRLGERGDDGKFDRDEFVQLRLPTCEEAEKLNKEEEEKYLKEKEEGKTPCFRRHWTSAKQKAELLAKYGCSDWYSWSNKYHGTKWGDCDTELDDDSITFSSAWGPISMEIISKLAEIFPDLHLFYEEEQGWGGEVSFADGEMIDLIEWDIPYYEEIDNDHDDYEQLTKKHKKIFDNLEDQVWYCDGLQGNPNYPNDEGYYYDYVGYNDNHAYSSLEELCDAKEEEAKEFGLLRARFDGELELILDHVRAYDPDEAQWNLYCFISNALTRDNTFSDFNKYEFLNQIQEILEKEDFEFKEVEKEDLPF